MAYDFESFRADVMWRVRGLNSRLTDPLASWPGVLILDTPDGLSAEAFALTEPARREELALRVLPTRIAISAARRFAWVMPSWRASGEGEEECLLVVVAERVRVEAALARVIRVDNAPPRLGRFSFGPFGAGARRVSGRFVEPLQQALVGTWAA